MRNWEKISEIQLPNNSIITVDGWESVGSLYRTQWGQCPVISNKWRCVYHEEDTPADEHLGGH